MISNTINTELKASINCLFLEPFTKREMIFTERSTKTHFIFAGNQFC
ncbi:MAG: hypothetical protein ISS57_10400 [Anaerolineales bacterium]|nr:hypothetical protein [Anaerolineales bacterium]